MEKTIFDGSYTVSESGEVFSNYHHRFLKGGVYPNGYEFVGLTLNGKTRNYMRHRLVAIAFIPNPNNLPYVNHIDGNKRNNRVENLEWCTPVGNVQHAIRTGLIDKVCKVEREVMVRHTKSGRLMRFDTMKDCCEFFGYTKCWLGNYQRKHGNPCRYKYYEITVLGGNNNADYCV